MDKRHHLEARFVEADGVFNFFKQRGMQKSDSPVRISSIRIATPFLTRAGFKNIEEHLARAGEVKVLTRASLSDWKAGASDPQAIDSLIKLRRKRGAKVQIGIIPALHAKVFILGNEALVGSANLTASGQGRNLELAVQFQGKGVAALKERFDGWFGDAEPLDEAKFRRNWDLFKDFVRERETVGYLHSLTGYYDTLVEVLGRFLKPVCEDTALRHCESPQLLDFLKGWELLKANEEGGLAVSRSAEEFLRDRDAFAAEILKRDASASQLVRRFERKAAEYPSFTYGDVAGEFKRPDLDQESYKWGFWGTRIRWLVSVGVLVELDQRSGHEKQFELTELGRALIAGEKVPVEAL